MNISINQKLRALTGQFPFLKWLRRATWPQKLILTVMAACILPFFGIVREDTEQRSGDASHILTEALAPGASFSQSFRASYQTLKALDFVVDYDDGSPQNGTLLFELLDAEDHVLHRQEIPYSQIGGYVYHRIELDMRLKRHRLYTYRITNLDITENMPRAVCTTDPSMHALPNRLLTFDGTEMEAKALTRYLWDTPLRLHYVLAFSAFIGLAGFTLVEAVGPRDEKGR